MPGDAHDRCTRVRIVVGLGGRALRPGDEPMAAGGPRAHAATAAESLALLAEEHQVVVARGGSPGSGGTTGYLVEQELSHLLTSETPLAMVVTMTEVDPEDPGSPEACHIAETRPLEWLLARGCVVVCAGGGWLPPRQAAGTLPGMEVLDEDCVGAVLAEDLHADLLVLATDVDAVHLDRGTPAQRAVEIAHPDALDPGRFPAGSMGPKVAAAVHFARRTGRSAVIGSIDQLPAMVDGEGGTRISVQAEGMVTR